jgi:hypothetical protein
MRRPKFCSMKISQEVRDFARLQEQATSSAPPPLRGRATQRRRALSGERGNPPEPSLTLEQANLSTEASAKAQASMAEMSKRFHEEGGEIYLPAGD